MEATLSILNFESGGPGGGPGLITSPRSLEACLRAGFDPKDLLPRRLEAFKFSADGQRKLTHEEQALKYEHFETRRREKIAIVREEREKVIEMGAHHDEQQLFTTSDKAVEMMARAEALKSAMMEMEKKRIEAAKKRQEKELQRLIENEKKLGELQGRLHAAEEEEIKRQKAHEMAVEAARKEEIERKKARDKELQRQAEEEEKQRREMARRDAELKEKLLAEARDAEKQRRREAVDRELERIDKLEKLKQRTEMLLQAQEEVAENNRLKQLEREARVKAQMDGKKELKAVEIEEKRTRAEKRIHAALEKNQKIQENKKKEFDERMTAARARAAEKAVLLLVTVKKQADERQKRVELRYKRLLDAAHVMTDKIKRTKDRADSRSQFYSVVAAKREKEMLIRKQQKDLSLEDKLDNVQRIRNIDAFLRKTMIRKQELDDERYERIKDERQYLIEQRKQTAQQAMIRKHRLKEAMEQMRVTNKFQDLDAILNGNDNKRRKRKNMLSASTPNLGPL